MSGHRYDAYCTAVRQALNADGVVLVVLNGNHGADFSVQAPKHVRGVLSDLVEHAMRELREPPDPSRDRGDGW